MKFTPESLEPLPLSAAERKLVDQQPDSDREARLLVLREQLANLHPDPLDRDSDSALMVATAMLESAGLNLDLDAKTEAWQHAKACLETFIARHHFEDAALACQYVYLCDKDDAISALGQAAWLSVTYPVNPHLTANVLDLVINEMPDESDGAAVAAATAHYVVDMRCAENEQDELRLFTGSMLARVARRHSNIESQQLFELWVERLELDSPEKFLVRLRNVIDVMVQEDWWFDRDALQAALPD